MVGIDGSEQSKLALKRAIDMAKHANAQLLIVTVEDDLRFTPIVTGGAPVYQMNGELIQQVRERVQDAMQEAVHMARNAGIEPLSKVFYGNAKKELGNNLPVSENVDLIIMGATGLNRIERMMIGSNSNYVLQNAPCDVMIVR